MSQAIAKHPTVIETTDNRLYAVEQTGDPNLAHVWLGIAVKKTKQGFVPTAKARRTLVSKAHCLRIVQTGA